MSASRLLVRRGILTIGIVAVVAVGARLFARVIPAGFIPDEDQGILGVAVQLPPGASLDRTSAVLKKVEEILAKTDGLESFQTIGGYGAVTSTYQANYGSIFARLKPWEERKGAALHVKGIMARLARQFAAIPEAVIFPFNIPTLAGFGAAAGFNFLLQDRTGSMTVEQLGEQTRQIPGRGRQRPELGNLFTSWTRTPPGAGGAGPREGAHARRPGERGLPGDVRRPGRVVRQRLQPVRAAVPGLRAGRRGGPPESGGYRQSLRPVEDDQRDDSALDAGHHQEHRGHRADDPVQPAPLGGDQGAPARGYTSGQALAALEQVFAETMPKEMGFAYSSISYQEKIAPPAAPTFILAIVCVFLLLAAMYESWRLPWAVLLGSPLVALGAFFGVWLMGYDNNVYVQIGLVMLIGLAAKNAILIVEFAKAKHEEGLSLEEAALDSARLRFRPILMTAFAFILGVVPLILRAVPARGRRT